MASCMCTCGDIQAKSFLFKAPFTQKDVFIYLWIGDTNGKLKKIERMEIVLIRLERVKSRFVKAQSDFSKGFPISKCFLQALEQMDL